MPGTNSHSHSDDWCQAPFIIKPETSGWGRPERAEDGMSANRHSEAQSGGACAEATEEVAHDQKESYAYCVLER